MTDIDIDRLAVDREYWNSVAPSQCDKVGVAYIGGKYWSHEFLVSTTAMVAPCNAEVEFILRPPEKEQEVEWDGGFLPEVGVECEFVHPGIASEGWQVGTIKAYFDDRVVIKSNPSIWPACGHAVILIDEELKFRPLKSQQERRQREELIRVIRESDEMAYSFRPDDIADAILSRYNLEKK